MSPVELTFWRRFGLLLRFIGGALLFVGVVAVVAGLGFLFDKSFPVPFAGGRTNDPLIKAIFPGLGFLMVIVGALLLLGYPFRWLRGKKPPTGPTSSPQAR